MNEVLHRLIMDNKGPWKDYSTECRAGCYQICKAVASEIIFSILGIHPEGCDGVSVEYDFEDVISIEVTFWERATHTAEQIANGFQQLAGVDVTVKVWECVSTYPSK